MLIFVSLRSPSTMLLSTYPSLCQTTIVCEMPRGLEALVSAVLAHGTDPDAVLHGKAADLDRSEELRYRLAGRLVFQSCSWRWDLSGSEVWHIFCCFVHRSGFVRAILNDWNCPWAGYNRAGALLCHVDI